jgi:hypothetical protein
MAHLGQLRGKLPSLFGPAEDQDLHLFGFPKSGAQMGRRSAASTPRSDFDNSILTASPKILQHNLRVPR